MTSSISRKAVLLVSAPLLFTVGFIWLMTELGRDTGSSLSRYVHSRTVLNQAHEVLGALSEAEAGVTGFILTGSEEFLSEYRGTMAKLAQGFETLESLVQENPEQRGRVETIRNMAGARMEFLETLHELARSGLTDEATVNLRERPSRNRGRELREEMAAFLAFEEQLDSERRGRVEGAWASFSRTLTVGGGAAVLLTLTLAFFFTRSISHRLRTLTSNARALMEGRDLDLPVGGRDEIARLDEVFHKMAAALTRSARKERALTQNAVDVICSVDVSGRFVSVNNASDRLWGHDPGSLRGTKLLDLVVPEDRERTMEAARNINRGESVTHFENRMRTRDGACVDMMWSAFWSEAEELMFCVGRDVSEIKRAQEALKRRADEIHDLYNSAPCGYHSLDEHGGFLQINDTELAWLGFTREELIGKARFYDLLTESSRVVFDENFPVFKERGWVKDLEFEIVRRDGTVLTALLNATAVTDEAGRYVASRSTLFDITERKRAEEEIGLLNVSLEEQATKLKAANEELESFSYSVSHDLRSPLRAIDGFSRILLEDYGSTLDSEALRLLNIIRESTLNMGNLIDDLLAFSRLGRAEIDKTSIDMREIARSVFDEITQGVDRGIEARFEELPGAVGDRAMIRQVLANLLSNAVKFSSRNPAARVEVGGWVENGRAIFYVKDNGVGFDGRYAHKLFGVFQRLHSPRDFEGTGVGLALVKRVVNRHGGDVWASSEPGQGATFFFALPREERNDERQRG